jgi:hypothetical protein
LSELLTPVKEVAEELPANLVFSKDPVKFVGNEKLPVRVTSAAEKFTDNVEV